MKIVDDLYQNSMCKANSSTYYASFLVLRDFQYRLKTANRSGFLCRDHGNDLY